MRPSYGVVVLAGGVRERVAFSPELERGVLRTMDEMLSILAQLRAARAELGRSEVRSVRFPPRLLGRRRQRWRRRADRHDRVTRRVAVRNASRDCVLADRAEVASGPWRRAVGLIGRCDWSAADGLVIEPCNSVHSFFMRFPIDVVHVGSDGRVLRTVEKMHPWRLGPIVLGSRWVLELPAGTLNRTGTVVGDQLERLTIGADRATAGEGNSRL